MLATTCWYSTLDGFLVLLCRVKASERASRLGKSRLQDSRRCYCPAQTNFRIHQASLVGLLGGLLFYFLVEVSLSSWFVLRWSYNGTITSLGHPVLHPLLLLGVMRFAQVSTDNGAIGGGFSYRIVTANLRDRSVWARHGCLHLDRMFSQRKSSPSNNGHCL